MKKLSVLFVSLLLLLLSPRLLDALSEEEYHLEAAWARVAGGNDEKTLAMLNEGVANYPDSSDLLSDRGNFYYERGLHALALKDYLACEKLGGSDTLYLWSAIARASGALGDSALSLRYWRMTADAYPDDEAVASDTLWSYFKNYRMREGVEFGVEAIKRFPSSPMLDSTLANLYSGLYDYPNAKRLYRSAVQESLNRGQFSLAAINLYNESLLEIDFKRYREAEDRLNEALMNDPNSVAYRLLGDIETRKLDYAAALAAYRAGERQEAAESAVQRTRTPLGKIGLMNLYLTFMRPEAALPIILDLHASPREAAWMEGFGTDVDAHLAGIYRFTATYWREKRLVLRTRISKSLFGRPVRPFMGLHHAFYEYYYSAKSRKYTLKSAYTLRKRHNDIASFANFISATNGYRYANRRFIGKGEEAETAVSPLAGISYQVLRALESGDIALLEQAYALTDPVYEASDRADLLEAIISRTRDKKKRASRVEELYAINAGKARVWGLPVRFRSNLSSSQEKSLKKYLKQAAVVVDTRSSYLLNVSPLVVELYRDNVLVASAPTPESDGLDDKSRLYRLAEQIVRMISTPNAE